jgi:cellulose synthase/poly-beta-1,6-N-acetylglucosamine synthase-like glycosyltransferase
MRAQTGQVSGCTNDMEMAVVEFTEAEKLFLVKKVIRSQPPSAKISGDTISQSLHADGCLMSPVEVDRLLDRHAIFFRHPYKAAATFAVVLGFVISWMWSDSAYALIGVGLLITPFLFVIFNSLIVAGRLFSFDPREISPPPVEAEAVQGAVSIVIASRNEPFEVAKMTFDSAFSLACPGSSKEIIIVDNSDTSFEDYRRWRAYVEAHADGGIFHTDGVKVQFVHRNGTDGFKPKNLDIAMEYVGNDYILYLDVDSTLEHDSLLKIMPLFQRDTDLAFVQLQAIPANVAAASPLGKAQAIQSYFLRFGTIFLANTSHALFYGHNAIWRTSVVRELGACLESFRGEVVVAEDLSMSLRASFSGYYGTGVWVRSGEWVPETMRDTESMWLRWTVGTFQVFCKHFSVFKRMRMHRPVEFVGWLQHVGALVAHGLTPAFAGVGLFLDFEPLLALAVFALAPELVYVAYGVLKLSLGETTAVSRLTRCYMGSLLLGAFLNWVRLVGITRFCLGKRQGWVPTGKARSASISVKGILVDRWRFALFGLWCIFWAGYWIFFTPQSGLGIFLLSVAALHGVHSLASIVVFGSSSMLDSDRPVSEYGHVDGVAAYYD